MLAEAIALEGRGLVRELLPPTARARPHIHITSHHQYHHYHHDDHHDGGHNLFFTLQGAQPSHDEPQQRRSKRGESCVHGSAAQGPGRGGTSRRLAELRTRLGYGRRSIRHVQPIWQVARHMVK